MQVLYFVTISYGMDGVDSSIIQTKSGKIQRTLDTSAWTQREYSEYKGIPYALAPIGPLRFEVSS